MATKRRKYKPVQREPVREPMAVFRFMESDSMDPASLERELRTEREAGRGPDGRESRHELLRDSRSLFAPKRKAAARWRKMRDTAASEGQELQKKFIAELRIEPDEGFSYEVDGKGGHLPTWGETPKLAVRVIRVVPGEVIIEEVEHDGV